MDHHRSAPSAGHGGRLAGRVALVTGAGRNIGRAIARRFAAEGAAVAVSDIDAELVRETVETIEADGGRAAAAVADLSDIIAVDRVFDDVEKRWGPVDVLVNNAYARVGATSFGPFLALDVADWQQFVSINTTLYLAPTLRAARTLAAAGRPGSVVNISSHGAARAHREHIPYDSVKGSMESFTRAVAVDLAPWDIRVNAVRPGSVAVEGEKLDWSGDDVRSAQIPLGRPASVDDIGSAALYLASDEASYVTGQIFNVDGGMAAQARAPQVEPHPAAGPGNMGGLPVRLTPQP